MFRLDLSQLLTARQYSVKLAYVPNLNIKISDDLMREIKIAQIRSGMMQKDWVTKILSEAVNVAPEQQAQINSSAADVPLPEPMVPKSGEARYHEPSNWPHALSEGAEDASPECPEDGKPLVWNKVLKRFECSCGYQGKRQRAD
jgi:hypothetical protein